MNDKVVIEDYELEAWLPIFGAFPIERKDHFDCSEPYEICQAHIYELKNGKYALVVEEGNSCYTCEDAEIEIFPTYKSAKNKLDKWVKEKNGIRE